MNYHWVVWYHNKTFFTFCLCLRFVYTFSSLFHSFFFSFFACVAVSLRTRMVSATLSMYFFLWIRVKAVVSQDGCDSLIQLHQKGSTSMSRLFLRCPLLRNDLILAIDGVDGYSSKLVVSGTPGCVRLRSSRYRHGDERLFSCLTGYARQESGHNLLFLRVRIKLPFKADIRHRIFGGMSRCGDDRQK